MPERKMVLYLSRDLPNCIADFYKNVYELGQEKIHVVYINRAKRTIMTDNVLVHFRTCGQNNDGYRLDEIFGCYDKWDLDLLKNKDFPKFSGSLVEYIKKIEENAVTDAFLKSELDKDRTRK